MAEPFLTEIRLMSFDFAPKGWAKCDGQLLPVQQNRGLFDLLGTRYGGDGKQNFALPDLRSRVVIHRNGSHALAETGGEEDHTLTPAEVPAHTHTAVATSQNAISATPSNTVGYARSGNALYAPATNPVHMAEQAVARTGGSEPHTNMQPYLTINFCIALQGIFPSASQQSAR
jgi:microcystin-dependent protein